LDNYFAGSIDNHVEGVEYRRGHTKDIAALVPEHPDLIYHLGEYSRVEQSVLEPDIVHDLNTVGTQAVVDYWLDRRCKLVYAGSSTKFGDDGKTRDTSPYASTKANNTELVKEKGESSGLPYAITYFYNVFGPGERTGVYGTVIESFKQMYLRGTPLTVTAPGTQERNFTHVDDIVDGLIVVGERGQGDEYGLGNERAYSLIEVAKLFQGDILMMPERVGNRLRSGLDTSKARELGWNARRSLEEYIREFLNDHPPVEKLERRILVFSTTFHPTAGPAEDALVDLVKSMPSIQFDIVTTLFTKEAIGAVSPAGNVRVYRVGTGRTSDKYLLPFLGNLKARELHKKHSYLFAWALMASYAALAGTFLKKGSGMPLLITLADQDLSHVPLWKRMFLSRALSEADQVYGGDSAQEKSASQYRSVERRSMGDGDAFANAIRFAYSGFVRARSKT
ncbi:MAG: NAD-dependent epimerase/dehydratase family protein, partial [Candidatus Paceibacterota bacterium]